VRPRLLVVLVTAVVLAAAAAWLLGLSLERVLLLAPALVLGTGLVLAVLILLGRAAAESIRSLERPRLVLALAAAGVAVLAILTLIGVELPRE
jgi:predicted RND superfamily exporter protein